MAERTCGSCKHLQSNETHIRGCRLPLRMGCAVGLPLNQTACPSHRFRWMQWEDESGTLHETQEEAD